MSSQEREKDGVRLIPAMVGWIARNMSWRVGSALLSRMPPSMRNFTTTVSAEGIRMKVWTGESIGRRMYYLHDYEQKQTQIFLSLVNAKTVLYDIGANMGYYSLLVALRGGKAFAFEPSPDIIVRLKENIELNKSVERITVVTEAVSDRDGTVTFYPHHEKNFGVGKIFKDKTPAHKKPSAPPVEVKTQTLESFVKRYGLPNLVKMDIEGAEYFILKDPPEILKGADAPVLFVEFHPGEIESLGGSTDALRSGLSRIGYHRHRMREPVAVGVQHAWEVFSKKPLENEYLVISTDNL